MHAMSELPFRSWWQVSLLVLASWASPSIALERPNVIVILTDDQGWGDLSFHGNANLSTPSLDSLARLGARFDRFYVCPVCAPTRAEFLTGRYHPRGGVRGVTAGEERLDVDEKTIARFFKGAGYQTAAFGKWHNGTQYPYHPLARGFDEFYGYTAGHWGDYFSPPQLDHNGKLVRGAGYLVDDITDHAISFIEDSQADPFFMYVAMPTPHAPMQVPDRYWEKMKNRELTNRATNEEKEDPDFTRAALAMVESVDYNVGRLLRKLDELSLAKDTIVVFFCDNGPNSERWNGEMKGKKGSTDEGGVRSPLFIVWPDRIKSGRLVTQIAGAIDLLPTIADLAGVPLVGAKPLDGVSLEPLIRGKSGAIPGRMIFSHWKGKVSVRTQHYRLDHQGNLYDMVLDPGQTTVVNENLPAVRNELQGYVRKFRAELLTGFEKDERPFPIGHPDFPTTQLPARDGVASGGVERSATAPNCSYFTNWSSEEGAMTWPVDVQEAGNFEVSLYYTCPEASVGTEVELSLGDASVKTTIQQAHEPPAVGAEHDRVPRKTQSLMKDFKPLNLGKIALPKGAGQLKLRSPAFVGQGPVEVRLLMFERVL